MKDKKRKTSQDFFFRNTERKSGYTPDLLRNPIAIPVGHYVSRNSLWIIMSDGSSRTGTDEEEQAWADGTLHLPLLQSHKDWGYADGRDRTRCRNCPPHPRGIGQFFCFARDVRS